jgi:hypothetical protein
MSRPDMGKIYEEISPELAEWLREQKIFFVATAPRAAEGFINCSPKGMDTFRILQPRQVAYLDLTGSGVETIAHSRENGRIVFMFARSTDRPRSSVYTASAKCFRRARRNTSRWRLCFPRTPAPRDSAGAPDAHQRLLRVFGAAVRTRRAAQHSGAVVRVERDRGTGEIQDREERIEC